MAIAATITSDIKNSRLLLGNISALEELDFAAWLLVLTLGAEMTDALFLFDFYIQCTFHHS